MYLRDHNSQCHAAPPAASRDVLRTFSFFEPEPEPGMLSLWLRVPGPQSASIRRLRAQVEALLGHFESAWGILEASRS